MTGMASPSVRHLPSTGASSLHVPAGAIVGYVVVYLLLDWISYVHPMRGLNITPWNPQAALAVALLMWRPGGWWLVALTLAVTDLFVRGMPASWAAGAASSAVLTLGHAITAAALRRWLGATPHIATRRAFLIFVLIAAAGAALNAGLYAGALAAFDLSPPERLLPAFQRGWIGETVSLVVVLPLLFVLRSWQRRSETLAMLRTVECWLVVLAAVVAAYAVFGQSTEDQFKFFYLLLMPVVWGAARFGAIGAVWSAALVQVLLIVAVQLSHYTPLTVFELHMLMAALAATGLLLGTTVDERAQAQRALRASLHLAAAGDMAAALAHELNQPLTALSTYAQASQLLVGKLGSEQQALSAPLADVTAKLVHEAGRAGDVVKRLRDFFRNRSTELQPTDVAELIGEVMRSQSARAAAMKAELAWQCDPALPRVLLDRVQIEVVLRNLVANALDAAGQAADGAASVVVDARVRDEQLVIAVRDSGPGVPAARLPQLFDSRAPSSKPGGMGIGLGISRTIVEAHGGRLWAAPGPGGQFFFSIPLATAGGHE